MNFTLLNKSNNESFVHMDLDTAIEDMGLARNNSNTVTIQRGVATMTMKNYSKEQVKSLMSRMKPNSSITVGHWIVICWIVSR